MNFLTEKIYNYPDTVELSDIEDMLDTLPRKLRADRCSLLVIVGFDTEGCLRRIFGTTNQPIGTMRGHVNNLWGMKIILSDEVDKNFMGFIHKDNHINLEIVDESI